MYNIWVAKSTMLPFEVTSINEEARCIAILPIKKSLAKSDPKYKEIKNLQRLMLSVLELPVNKLALITINYNEEEQFLVKQKNSLTQKLLTYYHQSKLILQFGSLDFLDLYYLACKKIFTRTILHPEYLLKNPEYKRQAYQDLLSCKTQLATLL